MGETNGGFSTEHNSLLAQWPSCDSQERSCYNDRDWNIAILAFEDTLTDKWSVKAGTMVIGGENIGWKEPIRSE